MHVYILASLRDAHLAYGYGAPDLCKFLFQAEADTAFFICHHSHQFKNYLLFDT